MPPPSPDLPLLLAKPLRLAGSKRRATADVSAASAAPVGREGVSAVDTATQAILDSFLVVAQHYGPEVTNASGRKVYFFDSLRRAIIFESTRRCDYSLKKTETKLAILEAAIREFPGYESDLAALVSSDGEAAVATVCQLILAESQHGAGVSFRRVCSCGTGSVEARAS